MHRIRLPALALDQQGLPTLPNQAVVIEQVSKVPLSEHRGLDFVTMVATCVLLQFKRGCLLDGTL